jgi:hypothetical protein
MHTPAQFQKLTGTGAFDAIATGQLCAATDDLLGPGRWQLPAHWGRPLVTFPRPGTAWNIPTTGWHPDSQDPELTMPAVFAHLAPVQPRGGGTLVVTGSHLQRLRLAGHSPRRCRRPGRTACRVRAVAYALSRQSPDRPTLIVVETVIGVGAPTKEGTSAAHSEPLGAEEARAAKRSYGWPEDADFLVPGEAYARFAAGVGARGRHLREQWDTMAEEYRHAHPSLAAELDLLTAGVLSLGWDDGLPAFSLPVAW